MDNNYKITTCPKCLGSGVLTGQNGSFTCPECQGKGMWLSYQNPSTNKTYVAHFNLPEYLDRSIPIKQKTHQYLGISILSLGAILFLLGLNLWAKGQLTPLVGISGLLIVFGTTILGVHHQKITLYDFNITEHNVINPLNQYTDWDIVDTIYQYFRKSPGINNIDLIGFINALLFKNNRLRNIIWRLEVDPNDIIKALKDTLDTTFLPANHITTSSPTHNVNPTIQSTVRLAIYQGFLEAISRESFYFQPEHTLLAILKNNPVIANIFDNMGVSINSLEAVSHWFFIDEQREQKWKYLKKESKFRPKTYMNRAWTALPTPFLDHYSHDLTYLASAGALSFTSTRDNVLNQIVDLLDKENKVVLLVAPPGLNYDIIINSLAYQIASNAFDGHLSDTRLISLSMSAFMDPNGSIEENLNLLLHEASNAGNVVIYIDDFHNLIGTSNTALDAASLFSNMLSNYDIKVICGTTTTSYRQSIKSNQKLATLLSNIEIQPLDINNTLLFLEEKVPFYEGKEKISVTYPAIKEIAKGADKYIKKIPLPDSALELLEQTIRLVRSQNSQLVSAYAVKEGLEQMTNIKITNPDQEESNQLLEIENILHQKVVGQNLAIEAVSSAIRRNRAGLQNTSRPISFLFVGPTGVGKTATAKAIAETLFGSENNLIRLDMSEYAKPDDINKIIGQPNQDPHRRTFGSLTEAVIENPYSLILLDEFEKADTSIKNLFLQLLDDGRLTDTNDETVDFTHAIIIATSNAGSDQIRQLIEEGKANELLNNINSLLQPFFKPELLNRFDGVIPFTPLSKTELEKIATLMLNQVSEKALARNLEISFSKDAISYISQTGYDPVFGARAMRRAIQDKVEDYLAKEIIAGHLQPGDSIQITQAMLQ